MEKNTPNDDFFLPNLCAPQSLFGLVLVTELLVLALEIYESDMSSFDWVGFGVTSLFAFWIVIPGAGLLCMLRPSLSRLPRWLGAACCFSILLGLTAAASIASQWLGLEGGEGQTVDLLALFKHLLLAATFSGILLRYAFLQSQLRLEQQAELKARVAALQARIHPHFLFNSMNIITSLIETNPELAEQVVLDLSELFRVSLGNGESRVPFSEEETLCKRYLQIEKIRLEERLQVEWNIDPLLQGVMIPSLMLQPLLENAIYHGIQPLPEGGLITVTGKLSDKMCEVRVVNPMPTKNIHDNHEGNQMAIENIRDRLFALYGKTSSLSLKKADGYFTATIRYPFADEPVGGGL